MYAGKCCDISCWVQLYAFVGAALVYEHKQINCWVQLYVFVAAALVYHYQHMYADQLLILAVHSLGCSSVYEHMQVFHVWNCLCVCMCMLCVCSHLCGWVFAIV